MKRIRNFFRWLFGYSPLSYGRGAGGEVKSRKLRPQNLYAMRYNCRNCGAPHDGRQCAYCRTEYSLVQQPIKKKEINWKMWLAIFVSGMLCAFVVIIYLSNKRQQKQLV